MKAISCSCKRDKFTVILHTESDCNDTRGRLGASIICLFGRQESIHWDVWGVCVCVWVSERVCAPVCVCATHVSLFHSHTQGHTDKVVSQWGMLAMQAWAEPSCVTHLYPGCRTPRANPHSHHAKRTPAVYQSSIRVLVLNEWDPFTLVDHFKHSCWYHE